MKAIILKAFGTAENLVAEEIPVPGPLDNEVLVKVKAISINPVDVKTRTGKGMAGRMKEYSPLILGWDISGVVTEVGNQVSEFKIGDEVFGMVNFPGHGKAYAEFVAAPASHLAKKPSTISHEEAAAATLAALTAWQAFEKAKIKKGDRVLIHGASGGVGHFAVQIAKYLGAYVIGTSSARNKDFILSLGVDQHVDYAAVRFEEVISDIDFALDTVGGENIDRSLEVVKRGGTLISIPSGLSESVTQKAKEKGVNGYFILVQSSGEDMKTIAELMQKGIIHSHVSKTFSFEQFAEAHKQMESGSNRGKIIIKI